MSNKNTEEKENIAPGEGSQLDDQSPELVMDSSQILLDLAISLALAFQIQHRNAAVIHESPASVIVDCQEIQVPQPDADDYLRNLQGDNDVKAMLVPEQVPQPNADEYLRNLQGDNDMIAVVPGQAMELSTNLRNRCSQRLRNILSMLTSRNSDKLELPAFKQCELGFEEGVVKSPTSLKPYAVWSTQEVCDWLTTLGMGYCEKRCKKWLDANPSVCFFTASPMKIDQKLGFNSTLHWKKILLAIDEVTGLERDPLALKAAQLDNLWVMRFLNDIGLPQYADKFMEERIDGRMLHYLTMNEIALLLEVDSPLHRASLCRGVEYMRECLARQKQEQSENSVENNENVAMWTANRVFEWVRVISSGYGSNLTREGVHGALMLYEPRFNANTLVDLLGIPKLKKKIRRTIVTKFEELMGPAVLKMKNDTANAPDYVPLSRNRYQARTN